MVCKSEHFDVFIHTFFGVTNNLYYFHITSFLLDFLCLKSSFSPRSDLFQVINSQPFFKSYFRSVHYLGSCTAFLWGGGSCIILHFISICVSTLIHAFWPRETAVCPPWRLIEKELEVLIFMRNTFFFFMVHVYMTTK